MLLAPRTLLLLLRKSDRRLEAMFGLIGSLFGSGNQHVGLEAKQFGLVPPFTSGCGRLKGGVEQSQGAITVTSTRFGQPNNANSNRQMKPPRRHRFQCFQGSFRLPDAGFDFALFHRNQAVHCQRH